MKRILVPAVAVLLAATTGAAALGGFTPAWSYVPAPLRARLAARQGGSLYLPARTPAFYRYRAGAKVAGGVLTVPFTNRVRVRRGLWRWTRQTFVWQVRVLPAGAACASWKPRDRTLHLSGNTVYWSDADAVAWRCTTDRSGRTHVLSASAPATHELLGDVVASGLDVSGRTSAFTVALAVTPTVVHRGDSVVVHGVAGGCTTGDTVTVISHAFPAAQSFAAVPAVAARVGAAGRFATRTRIPATRTPGRYVVTARCGGGNLGVSAPLTVVA
jgi:hypothetical protein